MSLCFSKPTDDFPSPSKMLYELFLTASLILSSASSSAPPTLISLPFSLHTCCSFCLECPSPDIYVACSFTVFKITCLRTFHLKFQLSSLSSFFQSKILYNLFIFLKVRFIEVLFTYNKICLF